MEKEIVKFLADVNKNIEDVLIHNNQEIQNMVIYSFRAKSKMLRPTLVYLTSLGNKIDYIEIVKIASAMEILHVATLIHDDIIDSAVIRRGMKSIDSLYGTKVAVILGDFLFAKCFEILSTLKNREMNLPEKTILNLAIGEFEELFNKKRKTGSFKEYLKVINSKTSAMFILNIGFILEYCNVPKKEQVAYIKFAKYFGIAFQLQDDYFDFFNKTSNKDLQIDLKNDLWSLPKIIAQKKGLKFSTTNKKLEDECYLIVAKYFEKAIEFTEKFDSKLQKESFQYTIFKIRERKY